MFQMRAVESPEPEASRSEVGFHAQMNTSDSWPRRVVAREAGISMPFTGSPKPPEPSELAEAPEEAEGFAAEEEEAAAAAAAAAAATAADMLPDRDSCCCC